MYSNEIHHLTQHVNKKKSIYKKTEGEGREEEKKKKVRDQIAYRKESREEGNSKGDKGR